MAGLMDPQVESRRLWVRTTQPRQQYLHPGPAPGLIGAGPGTERRWGATVRWLERCLRHQPTIIIRLSGCAHLHHCVLYAQCRLLQTCVWWEKGLWPHAKHLPVLRKGPWAPFPDIGKGPWASHREIGKGHFAPSLF